MFLGLFGTPALLWRVLHSVGYTEPPRYLWSQEYVEGQPWFELQVTIPARTQAPQWQEWRAKFEGKSPWEAAQVAAIEVLGKICQLHGDELTTSVAGTFPQVDPSVIAWL